ncbi:MAG: GNAT family N-acetyltransferase [Chloroflexi bacterium]|nr:GNAT family N-acetyltransferase [Chloroflexota bacterium]
MDALRPILDWITSLDLGHPTRVGLDGRSAAGKTTLADALAEAVQSSTNRPVVRASIDDFHHPGHKFRSIREEWTPQSYFDEGFDYVAFRDLVLQPLGPGGNRRIRTAIFDSFHDVPVPERWEVAPQNAILIVDGAYLQRDELRSHLDYLIWLKVDADTVLSRARKRDVEWVGSVDVVERRYRQRVLPTHVLYESLMDPAAHADAVIDTTNLNTPRLERLGHAPVLSDGVVIVDCLSLADASAHWAGEDDEHARRFGWYPQRSTLEGVRTFFIDGQRQWRDSGSRRALAIRTAGTRTLVGGCETRLQPDNTAQVSWWIFPEYRRQGLATRGVRLMLRYFSTTVGISKFVALIEPDNEASRGVAHNTGFIESGSDTSGPRLMLRYEYQRVLP